MEVPQLPSDWEAKHPEEQFEHVQQEIQVEAAPEAKQAYTGLWQRMREGYTMATEAMASAGRAVYDAGARAVDVATRVGNEVRTAVRNGVNAVAQWTHWDDVKSYIRGKAEAFQQSFIAAKTSDALGDIVAGYPDDVQNRADGLLAQLEAEAR